jgi:hypothetical protein
MKDLPVVAKAVINIILYIVYWAVSCLVTGIVMYIFTWWVDAQLADKIAIFGAVLILLVTLILRKYFYLCGSSQEAVVYGESYTAKKKPVNKKKITKIVEKIEADDDEIKIYVEKEIK